MVLSRVETLVACLEQRAMKDDMDTRKLTVSRLGEPDPESESESEPVERWCDVNTMFGGSVILFQ